MTRKRKLSSERAVAINRRRLLRDGGPTWERPVERVVLGENARDHSVDQVYVEPQIDKSPGRGS